MVFSYRKLKKEAYLLSACGGLGMSTGVISLSISAIATKDIIQNDLISTIPFGFQFLSVVIMSFFLSRLSEKFGRKPVLIGSFICGILSGFIATLALSNQSFILLTMAHFLLGVFLAATNLLRFAILDITEKELHAQAMNVVLLGGLLASIIGPSISRYADFGHGMTLYQSIYLANSLLAFCAIIIIHFVTFPKPKKNATKKPSIPIKTILTSHGFLPVALCAASAYGIMNLLMVGSGLMLHDHKVSFFYISLIIQIHVFFMYVPSLFTAFFIKTLGSIRFLYLGMFIFIIAIIIALSSHDKNTTLISMIWIGIGWNFLYVGGSYLLSSLFSDKYKLSAQGLNDSIVHTFTLSSSFLTGLSYAYLGWVGINIMCLVIIIILVIYFYYSYARNVT